MKQETFDSPNLFKEEKQSSQLAGGFLIIMGGIFFLGMSGITILGLSPWLLVALLPLYWIGVMVYKRYREDGRLSRRVFSILIWGMLPFVYIAAAFLGFNMARLWPIGLIAVGVSILLFGSEK